MKKDKVLLATGIFFPDVGGPAIHVRKIAERLSSEGYRVVVIAYGDKFGEESFNFKIIRSSRKYPKIIQWAIYLFHVLFNSIGAKVIYAFDPTSAGIPGAAASFIFRKPFLLRIGGDPIWERVVEKGKRFITISEYYDKGLYKNDNPKLFYLIKMVLGRAKKVIVYNQFFKDFYEKYFSVDAKKISIIKNPVFSREKISKPLENDPKILFAGRFVAYKNLPLVINVFSKVRQKIGKGKLVLIGKGPDKEKLVELVSNIGLENCVSFLDSLPQEKLFEYIKDSAFSIAPAINEFNPNFILESLSFGKPVLLSRGHGLSIELDEQFLFDPFNEKELEEKMLFLLDDKNYNDVISKIHSLDLNQTWENVTDSHLNLIKQI